MRCNPNIFKAYDIRGIYKTDFDEATAYSLGLALAIFRARELGRSDVKLVAARDMRLSSPTLHAELKRGLVDGGAEVIDIGLASTPTFYFAVARYGYDGGIQVSASHNPSEWNGFKLVRHRALPIGAGTGMEEIKTMVMSGQLSAGSAAGKITERSDIVAEQINHDLSLVNVDLIKSMKIVIDPANAMGSCYFDALSKRLPQLEIVKMNWTLDGTFPAHQADPFQAENIASLRARVKSEQADLGISTDGDGDRIFFVTDDGQAVEAGITRAVMCKLFLAERPGAKIAYDIRPGRITLDTIVAGGGIPVVTRVGHSLIKAKAVAENAYFAGESSGHFFLNMDEGCYEVPVIVALKMLIELGQSGQTFSDYIKPYQKYFASGEINTTVADSVAKLTALKTKYADGKLNELDGVTIEYPDYWFNVRPSNTEPLLRLNLEAVSQEIMEAKRDEILALIRA